MKNRNILHARQEVKIYRQHYQPSFNLWRVLKSILGLLFLGTPTVADSYTTTKKRNLR